MSLESRQLYGPFRFEHLTASSSVSFLPLSSSSSQSFLSDSSSPPHPFPLFPFLPLTDSLQLCRPPSSPPLFLSFFLTSPYSLISSLHPLTFSLCLSSLLPLLSCSLSFLFSRCLLMPSFLLSSPSLFLPLTFPRLLLVFLTVSVFTISFFPFPRL